MTVELYEPPTLAHRENPSNASMRNSRKTEASLAVCSTAQVTSARAPLLASWDLKGLMDVIARIPNAAVRVRILIWVVACVRRELIIDLWAGDILWFLQKALHGYLIDWQDQDAWTSASPAAH